MQLLILKDTVDVCIPKSKKNGVYSLAGWNDYVKEYHHVARDAFLYWCSMGKPRQGPIHKNMSQTRAQFKYALRFCKRQEDASQAESLAKHLSHCDSQSFWKKVKHMNKTSVPLSCNVDGAVGEKEIATKWKSHFEKLFNCINSNQYQTSVSEDLLCTTQSSDMIVSASEVQSIISKLQKGKACGPDTLKGEAFLFSHVRLSILLSCCFSAMLSHGFIPKSMMDTVIVPIVKNNCGKLSDINNYRPIALANISSKIFENILLCRCEQFLHVTDNQFGFKAKHSTDMCIYSLHECINYLKSRNTSVFVCCLDASKAFDRINHWSLFHKLIKCGVPLFIVRIIAYWYKHQSLRVKWGITLSDSFNVTNGVKQGGILSPRLFNVYIDELSVLLTNSGIGVNIRGQTLNHLCYADDICLIGISTSGMQKLLNICEEYGTKYDITYNGLKSTCLCYLPRHMKDIEVCFYLNNNLIPVTSHCKYLGTIISTESSDNDIKRQLKKLYAYVNILIRRFHMCSNETKLTLFRSYCVNLYCCQFWSKCTKAVMNKIRVAYNNGLRRLMNLSYRNSASEMFVYLNIPSFQELIRKNVYNFINRVKASHNSIINLFVSSISGSSTLSKWWFSVMHTGLRVS